MQRLRRKKQTNKRVKGIPEMKPLKRLQGRRKMPRSCSLGRKERRPRALPARAFSRKLPTGRTVSSFVLLQLNEGPLCNSGRETPPKLVQLLDMALPGLFALSRRAGGRAGGLIARSLSLRFCLSVWLVVICHSFIRLSFSVFLAYLYMFLAYLSMFLAYLSVFLVYLSKFSSLSICF